MDVLADRVHGPARGVANGVGLRLSVRQMEDFWVVTQCANLHTDIGKWQREKETWSGLLDHGVHPNGGGP
jgi:hypothetical protein